MTHREHCKTFKNLGLKYVEKYKYKTMQTNEAQYTNIMRFTKIKSTQGSQSTSYPWFSRHFPKKLKYNAIVGPPRPFFPVKTGDNKNKLRILKVDFLFENH